MSCPPINNKLTYHSFQEGYVKKPCSGWDPSTPGIGTFPSYDNMRFRQGCTPSPIINGFRKPTTYSNAFVKYSARPFDVCCDRGPGSVPFHRRKGRTVHGVFYGGPGSLGGLIESSFWVNQNGTCTTRVFDADMYNASIAEAKAKVADRAMEAGENIGELQSTINGVIRTAIDLYKLLRAIRKLDVKYLQRVVGNRKTYSRAWLEYQYMWKPMMADIYTGCQIIHEGLKKKGQFSVSSRKRAQRDCSSFKSQPVNFSIWFHSGTVQQFAETKYYFKIVSPWLATLNQMGIINPAAIAWNLMPYSFVLDWFLPIGAWLENLTNTVGTEFVGGYSTYGIQVNESLEWCDETRYKCGIPYNGKLDIKQFQRVAYTSYPDTGLRFKSPFSVNHLITAYALITQLR